MEQHAIPQQITSYEFKLVGDMTIKQFGKAAGGIILALLLNATPLIVIIKWPLMLILAAGGLAMAFVPFQDRPLETWIMSFIKRIYSPTIFLWKKKANRNWLDIDLTKTAAILRTDKEDEIPDKDEKKVLEFIASLPSVKHEDTIADEDVLTKPVKSEIREERVQTQILNTKTEEIKTKSEDWRNKDAALDLKTTKLEATGQAVFGAIPMPDTPTDPNILVGMVTDSNGRIVEEAIVEVQDKMGNPSRVLRTNSLGQFKTSSQLAAGTYLMITEKEGYTFDRVNINVDGSILKPIKIQAKAEK